MTHPHAAKLSYRLAWLPGLVNLSVVALRFLERSAGPLVDLLIRVTLAQVFFVSGVLKAANWDNALYLAANEYPVSWLNPVSAAWLGVLIELLGSVLFAAGLATRLAALALAALALVIQYNYQTLDTHLFWVALLFWFVVRGAGALSLDQLLARGLARTAVPFAAATLGLCTDATRWLAPLYALLLRLWLALAVLAAVAGFAIAASNGGTMDVAALLPVTSAAAFAAPLPLICAALLALGCATRPAALLLMLAISTVRMLGAGVEAYPYWFMALALMALWGPGPLSLDALVERALRRRFPQLAGQPAFSLDDVPRVVIVGAGFGGLACAAALTRARVAVTVIDRHNYHLFQPLLYQVATSGLSPGDIATPVRGLFREHFNVRVLFGEVTRVDSVRQEVRMDGQRIAYDYLVLATGAAHSSQVIRAHVEGRPAPAAFQYQHLGSLATIGRKAAVADFGFVKLHGGLAWWLWGAVHLGFLVGLRNRISVMLDWFWAYLTYRSGTRLITGGAGSQKTGQRHAANTLPRQGAA